MIRWRELAVMSVLQLGEIIPEMGAMGALNEIIGLASSWELGTQLTTR